jgi:hypothetical protein
LNKPVLNAHERGQFVGAIQPKKPLAAKKLRYALPFNAAALLNAVQAAHLGQFPPQYFG